MRIEASGGGAGGPPRDAVKTGSPPRSGDRLPPRGEPRIDVLIVEDDRDFGEMEADVLAQVEITALVARRVKEALAVLSRHQPAVMVVDLKLPDGNGYDLIAAARARGFSGQVVVVTGMIEAIPYQNVAAAAILRKPVAPTPFQQVIREYVNAAGLARQPERESSPSLADQFPARMTVRLGNCDFNRADLSIMVRGERISLTPNETRLFSLLAAAPATWVAAEVLAPQVWHQPWDPTHADKSHAALSRLNRKLLAGGGSVRIRASSRRGFKLDPGRATQVA